MKRTVTETKDIHPEFAVVCPTVHLVFLMCNGETILGRTRPDDVPENTSVICAMLSNVKKETIDTWLDFEKGYFEALSVTAIASEVIHDTNKKQPYLQTLYFKLEMPNDHVAIQKATEIVITSMPRELQTWLNESRPVRITKWRNVREGTMFTRLEETRRWDRVDVYPANSQVRIRLW